MSFQWWNPGSWFSANGNGKPAAQPQRFARPREVEWDKRLGFGPGPIPHAYTFSSFLRAGAWSYIHRSFDEALKHNRENARLMENDGHLGALLRERMSAVRDLKWSLKSPKMRDPLQQAVRQHLTDAIQLIPDWNRLIEQQLWALWFGRSGSQLIPRWRQVSGHRTLIIADHEPIHGDKIRHMLDGTPTVAISPAAPEEIPNAQWDYSDEGSRQLVLVGGWRERVLIHRHEMRDADFFMAEQGERKFGIGIRDALYWTHFVKTEWLAAVSDYMQRIGLGMTIWLYESGNAAAKAEVQEAANTQSDRVNLLVPYFRESGARADQLVQRIEVPVAGAQMLMVLVEHMEAVEERFIVGQSMSGGADNESGLGGSGRAAFAANTKYQIIRTDAGRLNNTISGNYLEPKKNPGLVQFMHRHTFPQYYPSERNPNGFPVWLEFNVPHPEPERMLGAVSIGYNMNIEYDGDEIRELQGMSTPDPEGNVISMARTQQMMMQLQSQVAQQQQAMGMAGQPPGGPPGGGQPPEAREMQPAPEQPGQGLLAGLGEPDPVYGGAEQAMAFGRYSPKRYAAERVRRIQAARSRLHGKVGR